MSIARSTPAQKPRGPARRISEIGTVATPERPERQQAEADADVVILEIGHPGLLLDVERRAVRALAGEDEGALLEGLLGVERGGGRRAGEQERNHARDESDPQRHGSM